MEIDDHNQLDHSFEEDDDKLISSHMTLPKYIFLYLTLFLIALASIYYIDRRATQRMHELNEQPPAITTPHSTSTP